MTGQVPCLSPRSSLRGGRARGGQLGVFPPGSVAAADWPLARAASPGRPVGQFGHDQLGRLDAAFGGHPGQFGAE